MFVGLLRSFPLGILYFGRYTHTMVTHVSLMYCAKQMVGCVLHLELDSEPEER